MPDRHETMHSVEDYLKTREEARKPQPIWSAQVVGICLIAFGAIVILLPSAEEPEAAIPRALGYYLMPLGTGLYLMGARGGARHRVTETTRYPQQTGEMDDIFFQVVGERYLWFGVASMVLWLILLFFA